MNLIKKYNEHLAFLKELEGILSEYCVKKCIQNPIHKGYILGKNLNFDITRESITFFWGDKRLSINLEDQNSRIKELYAEKRVLEEEKGKLNIFVNSYFRNKAELERLSNVFGLNIDLEGLEKQQEKNIQKKNEVYKKLENIEKELEKLR